MSEVKKIATRDSYGAALVELAKDHPDVVVLDADGGYGAGALCLQLCHVRRRPRL